jgi:hypothetical protein
MLYHFPAGCVNKVGPRHIDSSTANNLSADVRGLELAQGFFAWLRRMRAKALWTQAPVQVRACSRQVCIAVASVNHA